jgi:hypothetical protein
MHLMADAAPGQAVLLLGVDPDEDAVYDAWLSEGVGALQIPQGLTVLTGLPRDIADFAQAELVEPEADLTRLIAANDSVSEDDASGSDTPPAAKPGADARPGEY